MNDNYSLINYKIPDDDFELTFSAMDHLKAQVSNLNK